MPIDTLEQQTQNQPNSSEARSFKRKIKNA